MIRRGAARTGLALPEMGKPTVGVAANRPRVDPQRGCDLGIGEIAEVAQDDHRPLTRRQLAHLPQEFETVVGRGVGRSAGCFFEQFL